MSVRVGLVADTHIPEAGPDLPAEAYDLLASCDRILHCGDLHALEVVDWLDRLAPTLVSRGNGDPANPRLHRPGVPADPRISDRFVTEVAGVRIGVTHDLEHTEYRSDEDAAALLANTFGERVDIAVYGHSHVPLVWGLVDGTAIVNPGSPTLPYGYRGLVGTIGIIEVDDGHFEISIIDLATRKKQLHLLGPAVHPLTRGPRPVGGR